jgi:hypothetical protein
MAFQLSSRVGLASQIPRVTREAKTNAAPTTHFNPSLEDNVVWDWSGEDGGSIGGMLAIVTGKHPLGDCVA